MRRLLPLLFLFGCQGARDWVRGEGRYPLSDCEMICRSVTGSASACVADREEAVCLSPSPGVRQPLGEDRVRCSPDCHTMADRIRRTR